MDDPNRGLGMSFSGIEPVLDEVQEGFQIVDPQWRYLYVNQAVCQQGRRPREELLGRTMMECYPGIDGTPMFTVLARCMRDRVSADFDNEFAFPDGSKGWFELRVRPVPAGLLVVSSDVTDRRLVDAQMQTAQRMEAIGRLAGGIAHDFNNILTAILSFGDLALGSLDSTSPARDDLYQIVAAARRAESLVRQLLAYSRRQTVEPRVVDVSSHLMRLDTMLRRVVGADVHLRTIAPDGLRTRIDPTALEQVVLNLAVNARDAMPGGGRLTIEADETLLDQSHRMARGRQLAPGRYVCVSVSDTGEGMTPDVVSRLFEPFFTTKELGRGTGLGLSTCYGIVQQASGNIWVYSEPGAGTTFKVYLPRVDEEPHTPLALSPAVRARGSELVLFVEDDAQVRYAASRTLSELGYQVVAAGSGEEALAEIMRLRCAPDLLLTDVMLPGMDGPRLAARLAEVTGKPVPVVFVSGYGEAATVHHGLLAPGVELVPKPFTLDRLAAAVRATLDRR